MLVLLGHGIIHLDAIRFFLKSVLGEVWSSLSEERASGKLG